ncbi:DUF3341 domain-containing protein [Rhodocytophaga aerolata]|uniref:DUF3341 domain-containing protein n=1 Tax=Rhodocytophaga aerolata TaxID=455078 RepID=A0ABT8R617_9BACT|nr:DUF3341 domain-containing protein [Rhodocytophaga aerolata]MDO1447542.1 DUF3341 domain-containing protein [Rhodocytophaga aerolata]
METNKRYLVGVFDDEDVLLKSVKKIRNSGVKIHEVYTPFPIHGLDEALGYKRSRLPIAAFLFGITGTTCAVAMISLMLGYDWPMIIGGKPFVPIPDLVPVSFELTVLFAALGMVATFLITNNLWPGKKPILFDSRSTDNKFIMAVDLSKNKLASDEITSILRNFGATEVNTKLVEEEVVV